MTNASYFNGGGSFMSADLKRTAHRVRMAVDRAPVTDGPGGNPRKRRLVQIPDGETGGYRIVAPELKPAARHALAWGHR